MLSGTLAGVSIRRISAALRRWRTREPEFESVEPIQIPMVSDSTDVGIVRDTDDDLTDSHNVAPNSIEAAPKHSAEGRASGPPIALTQTDREALFYRERVVGESAGDQVALVWEWLTRSKLSSERHQQFLSRPEVLVLARATSIELRRAAELAHSRNSAGHIILSEWLQALDELAWHRQEEVREAYEAQGASMDEVLGMADPEGPNDPLGGTSKPPVRRVVHVCGSCDRPINAQGHCGCS